MEESRLEDGDCFRNFLRMEPAMFYEFLHRISHRELNILKQELRRTCAVDRPHISIKRFAISQQVGHGIVP